MSGKENGQALARTALDWEARYASRERLWSGAVTPLLPEIAGGAKPGRALDIGCGEGADLLWLAERGWEVVGVDVSATAIERYLEGARLIGAQDRASGIVGSAQSFTAPGAFDLISFFYLHPGEETPGGLAALITAQARRLRPGGRILVAAHAVIPPGRPGPARTYRLDGLLSALDGEVAQWRVELAEERWKDLPATGELPAARSADAVLVLRAP
ncbi:bifunctional 2-polyprenyl-6-hydroxyphenol methylase/3-demethylubiquinol 3-O-methyltransferase UbiG [Schaalia hyovaginalis]|uniref:Chemotaxis protein methyltransferase CheR n=1 Tax=Schaalia hyovaginalis TaxID=29316 RepID=A0A923IW81_9ACTO|nr:class I SAM-dependent methyltransferase [Schaalia hyovaginalis]MBB6333892.1 chemotaxis protein methyltransferase CheR [Schaalia hyovaginalis]MDY2668432.1 class I SAM-dependent methyltransferase [Schaalia hyovaginalis]